jgi:hypothetical protein
MIRQPTNPQATSPSVTGQCLCGAVRFTLNGPMHSVSVCHCGQCRRWHGHVGAYTNVKRADLGFTDASHLKWYASSDFARRGFCSQCGSVLFWDAPHRDTISVTAGSLDSPTGLSIDLQIFTEDKGDYYAIDPGIPVRLKSV